MQLIKCVFLDNLSYRILHTYQNSLNICIFLAEKELLAYKMKGKDGFLADEESDGKRNSVVEKI